MRMMIFSIFLLIPICSLWSEKVLIEDFCRHEHCQLSYDEISRLMSITRPGFSLLLSPDYDFLIINDEVFPLNKGDLIYRKGIFLLEESVIKNLKMYMKKNHKNSNKELSPHHDQICILIDAGHGGKDTGALSQKGDKTEKEINLRVAKQVGKRLTQYGLKVFYTRDDDTYLSLKQRVDRIERVKADYFISIHANASVKEEANGFEFFCRRKKVYSRLSPVSQSIIGKSLSEDIKTVMNQIMVESIKYEEELLGESLKNSFSQNLPLKDRGFKRAGFYVIKNSHVTSILIELGFMTNPKEVSYLFRDSQKFSKAIADGVISHLKQVREVI